ncbi:MAG: alpha/beta hydrolase [Pseudomonadota bacterium]
MRAEIADISNSAEALRFAVGGFLGFFGFAMFTHVKGLLVAISGIGRAPTEQNAMSVSFNSIYHPRIIGVICVTIAVTLGLLYMAAAGAPLRMLASNFGALLLGLAALSLSVRIAPIPGRWEGVGTLLIALLLLATSIFGSAVEGAKRWVWIGPFFIQTSLLFLPLIVMNFARTRNGFGTAGIIVAALATALQPDRAMAGVLAAGLVGCAIFRFDRMTATALVSAGLAFCISLLRADTLPAVAFVDKILYTAFDVHLFAGIAVVSGAALLLAPAFVGRTRHSAEPIPYAVFGLVWFTIILAAAIGNYPTPVVGYGSSAIIGYLLSLSALPKFVPSQSSAAAEHLTKHGRNGPQNFRRIGTISVASLFAFSTGGASGQETADNCARKIVEKVKIPNTVWTPGADGKQIPLWPENINIELPDYGGNAEMVGSGSPLVAGRTWNWATYISRPTMTIFSPTGPNTGAAMLVLPGGGYAAVAMDLEGTEICEWIVKHGATCVILKYRSPQVWRRDKNNVATPPDHLLPLEDAQRAMSVLRENAASYYIDPDKIGVIGFSAGAHLAAVLSNEERHIYSAVDMADEKPSRPDFAIIMYPGRFLPKRNPGTDLSLAHWMKISGSAPPTLLVHAMNDPVNNVRHSMAYGLALNKAGVPVDMRFFAAGCHAFGLRRTSDPVTTQWPEHALEWLENINMLG